MIHCQAVYTVSNEIQIVWSKMNFALNNLNNIYKERRGSAIMNSLQSENSECVIKYMQSSVLFLIKILY